MTDEVITRRPFCISKFIFRIGIKKKKMGKIYENYKNFIISKNIPCAEKRGLIK